MPERQEEKYVRELFATRFKTDLRKLPVSRKAGVKTADYELLAGAERAAVLEVKRLERTPRTPKNGWRVIERNGVCHAEREDNGPARAGRAIHAAHQQLRNYVEPKVLVFVNDESVMDVQDLGEAFNGFLNYGNDEVGYANKASAKIAYGDIREEKKLIDLYVWIDRHGTNDAVFRFTTDAGLNVTQRFFGCPESLAGV
jgi:hypothetical protein